MKRSDTMYAAVFFKVLWQSVASDESAQDTQTAFPSSLWVWLRAASGAADELLSSQGEEQDICKMLLNFGRRRGQNFLGAPDKSLLRKDAVFFGLFNPHTIAGLSAKSAEENSLQYLRSIAGTLELPPDRLLVVYTLRFPGKDWIVLSTALPHVQTSTKRREDGTEIPRKSHMRWVLDPKFLEVHRKRVDQSLNDFDLVFKEDTAEVLEALKSWQAEIQQLGEVVDIRSYTRDPKLHTHASWTFDIERTSGFNEEHILRWYNPPATYDEWPLSSEYAPSQFEAAKYRFKQRKAEHKNTIPFRLLLGERENASLLVEQTTTDEYEYDNLHDTSADSSSFLEGIFTFEGRDWNEGATKKRSQNPSLRSLRAKCLIERDRALDPESASQTFTKYSFDAQSIVDYMSYIMSKGDRLRDEQWLKSGRIDEMRQHTVSFGLIKSLESLSFVTAIYQSFQNATFPMKILESSISKSCWSRSMPDNSTSTNTKDTLSLARAFACITMFESGGLNLEPEDLTRVFAMSSGNSLFVAEMLLCDPATDIPSFSIRRITGSIGRSGISLLVSPKSPTMKKPSHNFMAVVHADYDFRREDNFRSTTMHLGFTEWQVPLLTGEHGFIDSEVFLVEGVVSIRDRGERIADLDVITALQLGSIDTLTSSATCWHDPETRTGTAYTSLDSWDELLEPPEETVGIVRARGNWVARLAATCIIRRTAPEQRFLLIKSESPCWTCLDNYTAESVPWTERATILID